MVVVVIIATLAAIALISYSVVQRDAADSARDGTAKVITDALEKYYDANGEYPSVRSLVNGYADNTGASVATKLGMNADDLLMPNMSGTNPFTSSAATQTNDFINYTASRTTNNSSSCQTSATGGCEKYTLTYVKESGDTVTITSRRQLPS